MNEQPAVFINLFEVEPRRQPDLLRVLTEGANEVIRHRPGFRSLVIYASADGRTVINIASWDSASAAQATRSDPGAAGYAARAAALASPRPGMFVLAAEVR